MPDVSPPSDPTPTSHDDEPVIGPPVGFEEADQPNVYAGKNKKQAYIYTRKVTQEESKNSGPVLRTDGEDYLQDLFNQTKSKKGTIDLSNNTDTNAVRTVRMVTNVSQPPLVSPPVPIVSHNQVEEKKEIDQLKPAQLPSPTDPREERKSEQIDTVHPSLPQTIDFDMNGIPEEVIEQIDNALPLVPTGDPIAPPADAQEGKGDSQPGPVPVLAPDPEANPGQIHLDVSDDNNAISPPTADLHRR
jgi:hypothetical protein